MHFRPGPTQRVSTPHVPRRQVDGDNARATCRVGCAGNAPARRRLRQKRRLHRAPTLADSCLLRGKGTRRFRTCSRVSSLLPLRRRRRRRRPRWSLPPRRAHAPEPGDWRRLRRRRGLVASKDDADAFANAALDEIDRVSMLFDAARTNRRCCALTPTPAKTPSSSTPRSSNSTDLQRISRLSKGAYDVTAAAYDAWSFSETAKPEKSDMCRRSWRSSGCGSSSRSTISVSDPVARTARLKRAARASTCTASRRRPRLRPRPAPVRPRRHRLRHDLRRRRRRRQRRKGDRPWMVGVQDPRAPGRFWPCLSRSRTRRRRDDVVGQRLVLHHRRHALPLDSSAPQEACRRRAAASPASSTRPSSPRP